MIQGEESVTNGGSAADQSQLQRTNRQIDALKQKLKERVNNAILISESNKDLFLPKNMFNEVQDINFKDIGATPPSEEALLKGQNLNKGMYIKMNTSPSDGSNVEPMGIQNQTACGDVTKYTDSAAIPLLDS